MELIAGIIAEAFIEAIQRTRQHSTERAKATWRWIQQATEAPPGLELVAADGAQYSGFIVVDRSRAVMLIAIRHSPQQSPSAGYGADRTDCHVSVRQRTLFGEDELAQDERSPLYRR